jgi:Histidinol phosphatase and related hydrolases of the PHP family
MKIAVDTHTHSVASGHAYSTVYELALGARKRRLKGFVLSDHGPGLPGGTHRYHFGNLRVIPTRLRGVRFFKGCEANIMDEEGGVDLEPHELSRLDFAYAGFHELCLAPMSEEANTRALIAALRHPLVDAVSHPGNPNYPVDIEAVVAAAKENGKAIEINDSSFRVRQGSAERCERFARLCAETGTLVVCASDAHYWEDVGRVDTALALIEKVGVPKQLVINATLASFESFVARRAAEKAAYMASIGLAR